MLRRRPLASALITLYGPARAGVLLQPADGRWPEHEPSDRLALGAGTAALAAAKLDDERFAAYRNALADLARRIVAAGEEPLPGGIARVGGLGAPDTLQVVAWDGPGRASVTSELARGAAGLVPSLRDPPQSETAVAICALALAVALAVDAGAEDRLALALALEGVVSWYRTSHRMSPSRHALAFALAHARDRLREAGRTLPAALRVEK